MAADETKESGVLFLTQLSLLGLTAGVYDLLGDGAFGLTHGIGGLLLPGLEQEKGLEITATNPADILREVGRVMVEDFDFAEGTEVVADGDVFKMKVRKCASYQVGSFLVSLGIQPFICPYMALANGIFDRLGIKAMSSITLWEEEEGSIITFELL
ncbi:MAG: hypothetical protein JXA42_23835 [Anaerolineales bacterium]|nr:hypothetical protein [Anaerolineales bacterium]